MTLGKPRNAHRDFEILKAAIAGVDMKSLAKRHNLTLQRIQAILTTQRHKILVSNDPLYRSIRESR